MKQDTQTPDIIEPIPGQLSMESVLDDTHASEQVQTDVSSQQGRTGAPANDTHAAKQSPDNITSINNARSRRKTHQGASQVQNAQTTATRDQTGLKSPENALKSGAGKSGAEIVESGAKQVRKQGQRGKDKQPRKIRYDNNQFMIPADDRQRIVKHNLDLYRLGTLKDRNDLDEVLERIESYFNICAMNAVMPTVAGFALALGVDRNTLWDWMDGKRGTIKNPDVVGVLKRIYSMINTQYEELLTEGKMIPVGAFFLLQNNHGYKNQTDHVVVAAGDPEPDTADIAARAGLLEEGER